MILKKLFPAIYNASTLGSDSWMSEVFLGTKAASGERITPRSALGFSAYFACIRAISEDVGKLPLIVYERMEPRGKRRRADHAAYSLLHDAPNEEMTAMSFRETLTSHALGWSGGFAEIVRRGDGRPAALYPLDPNTVKIQRSNAGRLRYVIGVDGRETVLLPEQVLHLRGLGFDAITQFAITSLAKESIGAALGGQRFSGAFFGNSATGSGVIEVPGAMKDEQLRHLREAFAERHQGAANAYKPFVLENGAKWEQISTDPEKSQLINAMQFNVEDVARWFRVPPHKIGSLLRATFSNIEHQGIEYVVDTLTPWLTRWEQEIKRKLFLPSEGNIFAEHLVAGLMRGDAAARSTYYREQWNIGALSQNDIRDLENMNPIGPEGDVYYVPLNMVPSEIAAEGPQDTQSPQSPATEPPDAPSDPAEMENRIRRVGDSHQVLLSLAINNRLREEVVRVQRQAGKKDSAERAKQFYAEAADHVFAAISPAIDAFCDATWAVLGKPAMTEPQKLAVHHQTKAICARHVEQSLREMSEPSVVAAWASGARADLFARTEIENLGRWLLGLAQTGR